ncbi:MAG: malonyl-ACP O-methyltransferase BioC [Chromatiaceae bacterium]|nr:malonyl-ACP O-methyltransferase BioC [Chromatiaceae bacterium]MCP5422211.1 malonyl-ACP O-methyltransferase BioC [Chromatiaceae bacterium]
MNRADERRVSVLDKVKARRSFGRAADRYDDVAVLQHEIGRRMLERLETMRIAPRRILDLGCGTGVATGDLLRRYPQAEVFALDFALPMLQYARRRGRWLRRPRCLCADLDRLPLADQSVDLVFANAALQWSGDPLQAFTGIARVLRPGGLLLFTSFGPDTLSELRAAWAAVDASAHVHAFVDMHDYGDMLLHAGLADPVMDVERMTLTYADVRHLMREIKIVGAGNASVDRARGLLGRRRLDAVCAAYEHFRDGDGRLPVTYEVVHGHAWAPVQRRVGDETRIGVDVLRGPR